jgi:hypothetical protein
MVINPVVNGVRYEVFEYEGKWRIMPPPVNELAEFNILCRAMSLVQLTATSLSYEIDNVARRSGKL